MRCVICLKALKKAAKLDCLSWSTFDSNQSAAGGPVVGGSAIAGSAALIGKVYSLSGKRQENIRDSWKKNEKIGHADTEPTARTVVTAEIRSKNAIRNLDENLETISKRPILTQASKFLTLVGWFFLFLDFNSQVLILIYWNAG